MRAKKKRRPGGSCHWAANVAYAAGSVGHNPNTGATNSRKTVIGNKNAVMNPPREKRPHKNGSRKTPGSPVFPAAGTFSRPGFHPSDPRVDPSSSAIQT